MASTPIRPFTQTRPCRTPCDTGLLFLLGGLIVGALVAFLTSGPIGQANGSAQHRPR